MKSKTIFAVLMSSASAACFLTPVTHAADVASSADAAASQEISSARPSLQISSEVTPDFLTPAPSAAVRAASPRAQWQENPLLQPRKNGDAWLENSGVQLLDAPPQAQGFEIEILPAQTEAAPDNLLSRAAKNGNEKFPVQTQQAAKIAVERAQLLERAGVPVMAGAQLRRAVALAPRDIASRRALARWTAQHEQWPEAAAQWREVLYQLRIQSAVPAETASDESAQRELWREEATREMRTAQEHLLAFWQVPNIVTLGADSKNPVARSTMPTKQPAAITVAATSTALSKMVSSPVAAKVVTKAAALASNETAPLVTATPEPVAVPVKSAVENVVAALPNRPAKRELRFDIVITSSSYLRPQKPQNVALQVRNTAKITGAAKMNEVEKSAPVAALDSSREAARLLSMQRQMQPWLGDIVRIGTDNTTIAENKNAVR